MNQLPVELQRRSDPHADIFRPRQVIVIPERGTHIPSFYVPHENPEEIAVKKNGVLILLFGEPYCVADVAPERRWAIGPDGELMEQHIFQEKLLRMREEWYLKCHDKPMRIPGDLSKEYTPSVAHYVSLGVDATNSGRLTQINYVNRTAGAKPKQMFDSNGENPRDRKELLRQVYRERPWTLTAKEREEVEGGMSTMERQLTNLTIKLHHNEISPEAYAKEVAELVPRIAIPVPPSDPMGKRPGHTLMPCAVQVPNATRRRHIEKCETCAVEWPKLHPPTE